MNSNSISEGLHHADQSLPYEWHAVEYINQTFVVRDVPEGTASLYAVTGKTRNVRVLATTNHVLYEGDVVSTNYDDDLQSVELIHNFGGRMGRYSVGDWLDKPVIKLKKIPQKSDNLIQDI
jgi:hypothetical protein